MKAKVNIDAGICGFYTTARVTSEDGQNVVFNLDSECEKILAFGKVLGDKGPVDAYQEISEGGPAVIMTSVKGILTGCCSGCAVPVGLFKAMQVAAGLALA
jgi:hypothetical protein